MRSPRFVHNEQEAEFQKAIAKYNGSLSSLKKIGPPPTCRGTINRKHNGHREGTGEGSG